MSQKKCPKCGEDNPAEAVMCWACYTPLAAGPAPAGGARAPIAKPNGPGGPPGPGVGEGEEGEKKKLALDPKVIGLLAFLVVGGGIAAFMNMKPSSSGDGEEGGGQDPPAATTNNNPPANSGGGGGGGEVQVAQSNVQVQSGTLPAPASLPYTPVVPPNPGMATATIGIVPAKPNMGSAEAASLARFAKNQYQKSGRWTNIQIFVFDNQRAAQAFGDYQARRRGAPLSAGDYQSLANANVWSATPACYEMRSKTEFVTYPAKNPSSWWSARRVKS